MGIFKHSRENTAASPNLTIAGTGNKQQATNIEIAHVLDLTDRELDVNGNTVYVLLDSINAIIYDRGGYVNTAGQYQKVGLTAI